MAGGTSSGAGLLLLASPCSSTNVVFHALAGAFGEFPVVMEPPQSRWTLVKRRAKRLGIPTVIGQLLFSVLVVPVVGRRGRTRIAAIAAEHGLDLSSIGRPVQSVPSVNSDEARALLRRLDPSVVVVNGTRIISEETLGCVDATFVNVHMGITPQYRGVHGGYWALAEGRPELVGTTVHVINRGIDTGPILGQATFPVTPADSFATYPYLHLHAGLPLLVTAVRSLLAGEEPKPLPPMSGAGPSTLRSHPTLWGYAGARLRRAVR